MAGSLEFAAFAVARLLEELARAEDAVELPEHVATATDELAQHINSRG